SGGGRHAGTAFFLPDRSHPCDGSHFRLCFEASPRRRVTFALVPRAGLSPRRGCARIPILTVQRAIPERCRSGRSGRSRKPVWTQVYRGFESLPLRSSEFHFPKALKAKDLWSGIRLAQSTVPITVPFLPIALLSASAISQVSTFLSDGFGSP